ncbi:MAG: hypothetical protein NC823_02635, partial [Candidatus Omnitrophica bacterium]|nr:hypothetical protein [Candidatus Omnitrophota bacterium]
RDYGAYYANEWLKRGVGLYWDNTYLTTATNPLTSAAYVCEDGSIQPGLTLWNQREYTKRIWNLLHHWRQKRGEKLLFLHHMTNANLLPILSWCTTSFDNEFDARRFGQAFPEYHQSNEPFPPEYLQAQSMGRQVGNYPALCHGLFRWEHLNLNSSLIPREEMDNQAQPENSIYCLKREWGMRRVHEIPASQTYRFPVTKLESALLNFGYDTPEVKVFNYWQEKSAVRLNQEKVKWLLLARQRDKRLFLLLQSWSRQTGEPLNIQLDYQVIGFQPKGAVINLETGEVLAAAENGSFTVNLQVPYEIKILGLG